MRICAIVAYDGTDFFGWQVQPDKRTVQGVLEDALSQLFKTTIKITGSGRTDTGVHAQGQTFSFMVDTTIPPNKIYRAINPLLPPDVKVLSTKKVPDSFNARSSAKKKTSLYRRKPFKRKIRPYGLPYRYKQNETSGKFTCWRTRF